MISIGYLLTYSSGCIAIPKTAKYMLTLNIVFRIFYELIFLRKLSFFSSYANDVSNSAGNTGQVRLHQPVSFLESIITSTFSYFFVSCNRFSASFMSNSFSWSCFLVRLTSNKGQTIRLSRRQTWNFWNSLQGLLHLVFNYYLMILLKCNPHIFQSAHHKHYQGDNKEA